MVPEFLNEAVAKDFAMAFGTYLGGGKVILAATPDPPEK